MNTQDLYLAGCPGTRELHLPDIDEAEIGFAARMHKALSDETRLRILKYLQAGELCVCEIYEALDKPQPTVSHHLLLLQTAGLIKKRKSGRWALYSIDRGVLDLCNPFCKKDP
jgi:ArsR family transcriptional regulator